MYYNYLKALYVYLNRNGHMDTTKPSFVGDIGEAPVKIYSLTL